MQCLCVIFMFSLVHFLYSMAILFILQQNAYGLLVQLSAYGP